MTPQKILISTLLFAPILLQNVACASTPLKTQPNPPPVLTETGSSATSTTSNPTPIALKTSTTNATPSQIGSVPLPQITISDVSFIRTQAIATTTQPNSEKLDVTLIDDFIEQASPHARHYPPSFANRTQRYRMGNQAESFAQFLQPYATKSNASFDLLMRVAKINGMGRNMDLGSDYTVRASNALTKALKLKPNDAEANYLYGMILSESGAYKDGKKYLEKAAAQGYIEAEQSMAQAELLNDRRSEALRRLRNLQQRHPDNTQIRDQIQLVENGQYYLWDFAKKS